MELKYFNDDLDKYNYNTINIYYHQIANEYYNKNNFNVAIIMYDKLLDNIVDYKLISQINSNKSACYLNLHDYFNSLKYALIAVEYNNYNSIAWGRVGWSYKGLKNNEVNALKAFKIANKLNPKNPYYFNEICWYQTKKINNLSVFNIIKSSHFIINKLKDKQIQNKILNNNFEDILKDHDILNIINNIIENLD